jgi:hypothetical protein
MRESEVEGLELPATTREGRPELWVQTPSCFRARLGSFGCWQKLGRCQSWCRVVLAADTWEGHH